jgi:2-dehydropantoate 2-reductase
MFTTKSKKRYAIIGAGALGGYYGGLLARSGLDVHFLTRSDTDHIKLHGLRVDSIHGDFVVSPAQAYSNVLSIPKCDVIIIALKSTQNHLIRDLISPLLKPDSVVLVLQNGLHVESNSEAVAGPGHVMGGCCFLCSNKVGPGHIRHMDYGHIAMGAYLGEDGNSPAVPQSIQNEIHQDFLNAGIRTELVENLQYSRWKKLMWNIPFNGLSVAMNAPTDKVMTSPTARQLAIDLMIETQASAKASGIDIADKEIEQMIAYTDSMVPYDSSMRLDFLAGRTMEIEAIVGRPLREAKRFGYVPKKIEMLYQQLCYLQK